MLLNTQDQHVFNSYKPLRNAICNVGLAESLYVVRAYVQNLQFDTPIPIDCEVHRTYASATSKMEKATWINEHLLETLCREIIIHASEGRRAPQTLRKWQVLSKVINKLHDLENSISERFSTPENVLHELHRAAHRQFPWQSSRPSARNIIRYLLIYKHPPLEKIIHNAIGLNVEQLFLVGMALLGTFLTANMCPYPPNIEIRGLSQESLDRFLKHFCLGLDELRQKLRSEAEMNEKFSYAYNSMRAYPLIRIKSEGRDSLVCPLPTILFWRYTSGVFYEICGQSGFANAFGESFQSYTGRVLKRGTSPDRTHIYPEVQYKVGRDLKRTADWIMEQENVALFIEAKAKRLTMEAKVEGISREALFAQLDKMAAMIVQVYKSIRDYRNGYYPSYQFNEARQIYPMVVTLEDWFLMGPLISELDKRINEGMKAENVPASWMVEMPYTVCSIQDLESAVQIMDKVGIEAVMREKAFNAARREWTLAAHVKESFKSELPLTKFLFQEEYDNHVDGLLRSAVAD